jgi:hypothetical protein
MEIETLLAVVPQSKLVDIMLRTPAFLGFPMVRRSNRRLLVATTYAALLALMAAVIIIFPSGRQMDAVWLCVFPLAYNLVSRAIFGKLVKETVLPEVHGGELTSLGLAPGHRRSEDEPDEREVAVRNAAYFEAYRALAMYSIAVWVAWPFIFLLSASTAVRVLLLLTVPLLAMVLTLPQAVVLWTEPDVPEEARV